MTELGLAARFWKWLGAFTVAFWLMVVGVLAALLAVQTVRLEGLHVWPISITGWIKTAEDRADTLKAIEFAQGEAARLARQARLDAEAKYRTLAETSDAEIAQARTSAAAAAHRFIAANRLRPEAARCPAGGARAAGEGDGPGVPAPVPADPLVAVGEPDVHRCSAAAAYAVEAHNWALSLEKSSSEGK